MWGWIKPLLGFLIPFLFKKKEVSATTSTRVSRSLRDKFRAYVLRSNRKPKSGSGATDNDGGWDTYESN